MPKQWIAQAIMFIAINAAMYLVLANAVVTSELIKNLLP